MLIALTRGYFGRRGETKGNTLFSATVIASASEQESDYVEKAKQKMTYIPIIEPKDIPVTGCEELPPPDQGDLPLY